MTKFEIYFSDLNISSQKELMKTVGIKDPKERNWDLDIIPIAIADFEEDEGFDET